MARWSHRYGTKGQYRSGTLGTFHGWRIRASSVLRISADQASRAMVKAEESFRQ